MKIIQYFIGIIVFSMYLNNGGLYVYAQQKLDLTSLANEAIASDAYEAAAYLLYADYLRSPKDFNKYEETAYYLTQIGEYATANALLSRLEETDIFSDRSDSLRRFFYYSSKAEIALNKNDYINTILYLSESPALEEHQLRLKADSYLALGLFEEAQKTYSQMFSNTNQDYVDCLIGECYRKSGQYDKAIEYYTYAIEQDSSWGVPYYGRGWSYELSGNDDEALKNYNAGIEADQSYAYIYLMRGELFLRRGEQQLAEEDFKRVLRIDTVIGNHSCRQYALFFLGRYDDALFWMNSIIDSAPNEPGNYYDKACLCCRMGLYDEAIDAIKGAFEKGYRQFAHLDADDDIDPIKTNPGYIDLYNKYYDVYLGELEQLKGVL